MRRFLWPVAALLWLLPALALAQSTTPGGSTGGGGGTTAPVQGSLEQDVRGSGALNAASTASVIDIPVNGQGIVGLRFSGLAASGATVSFFQSVDGGTTETAVNEVNAGTGVPTLTRTTDGQTRINAAGRTNIKIRVSTVGTGSISVAWTASVREGIFSIGSPLPPGTNPMGFIGIGQYNATLPTLASGAYGYAAIDANGRQILAPSSTVGLTGTLPAFAATPTFNVGTTGGLVLDASIIARLGTLGQKTASGSAPVVLASDQPAVPVTATSSVPDVATTTYSITATGPQIGVPLKDYASLLAHVLTGSYTATVEYSINSTNGADGDWDAIIFGYAPEAPGSQLGTTMTAGTRRRVYNTNSGAWARINVTAFTTTGTIALIRRTEPYAERSVFVANASLALSGGANVIGGVQSASSFSEAFRTSLAANATSTGATRDLGATVERYARFGAVAVSDQAGTLQVQTSTDGTNWIITASQAVTANTPADLSTPIRARYHRAVFINGATATGANGFSLLTSFTAG